jgi:GntR family transcriptional regulator
MNLVYNKSIPLYYQLEKILREKIEHGEFGPEEKLPTEEELARDYRVSKITVRHALAALVNEGLLHRRRGKGTYVSVKDRKISPLKLEGSAEDLIAQGLAAQVNVLGKELVRSGPRVAAFLQIPAGSEVVRFKRVRKEKDITFSYVINHLLPEVGERVNPQDLATLTMLQVLDQKLRVPLGRIQQILQARLADMDISQQLGVSLQDPVLHVETDVYFEDGRPLEIVDTFYRADLFRYTIELHRAKGSDQDKTSKTTWERTKDPMECFIL